MTNDEAVDAMKRLLWELPAEFSSGPPDPRGYGRESFTVIKTNNVRRVHQALYDLQVFLGMQEDE